MKGIKLVLFDVDDTLYDFERNWQLTVESVFQSHPLTSGYEQKRICSLFNRYSEMHWSKTVCGELTFQQYRRLRLQETLEQFGETLLDEAFDSFTQAFIETSLSQMQADVKVRAVLQRITEQYAVGIITNGANDTAREKLARLGLSEFFPLNTVIVSSDVGVGKPDPAIFDLTLKQIGYRAEETVFVGDSWSADIVGALNAGLHAIWFNPKGVEPLTTHEPLAIIKHLSELEHVLKDESQKNNKN
ncbi:HAD family hydrolase [Paenibacillus solisilvae]|uniref:HAD family hydrolase n=1 Tax=Paenibacillus solisilvae TaxID=2486751 RepID=A0ABW0W6S6_9BACL